MSRSVPAAIETACTRAASPRAPSPRSAAAVCLAGLFVLLSAPSACQGQTPADEQPPAAVGNRYALLIGCTTYPNLDPAFHLVGPANDVVLAKTLLVDRFDFPAENVVILSDKMGTPETMPTKANIARQWQELAKKSGPGDQLVVLMAGHGTQTPQVGHDDNDVEPDGMDEMFLPRDVGLWNDVAGEVENGIKDDDIRGWIADIQAQGANLLVIIDACHSGTMTRDAGDEIKRELKPQTLGVPDAVIKKVAEKLGPPRDTAGEEPQLLSDKPQPAGNVSPKGETPVLVAIYAAQSIEPTVEKKLPSSGDDRKYYGLLTYTLNEILTQAESKLTYRELVQKIHRRYVNLGRTGPTPVLEGNGIDREVFGVKSFPERARLSLTGSPQTGWRINGGSLNGITTSSILAVYPPAGEANADQPIGHVKVLEAGFHALEAAVEPCQYAGMPAPAELAAGMRCQAVYVDLGDSRLRLYVDQRTDLGEPLPDDLRQALNVSVAEFVGRQKHLALVAATEADADWLLRYDSLAAKQLFLVPVSGWPGQDEGKLSPLFGPAPQGDARSQWLAESLQRISRVQNLLRLGGDVESDAAQVQVEILRYADPSASAGEPVRFGRGGVKLYDGDVVGFHVQNTSDAALDVTVLMIDSGYGIHPIFPKPGETNRLFPKNEVLQRGVITTTTTGLEHLVVIGVQAQSVGEPVDFSFLSQDTLERARASSSGNAFGSPLGKLFQSAFYGEGSTRGVAPGEMKEYGVRILSWQTRPEPRPNQTLAAAVAQTAPPGSEAASADPKIPDQEVAENNTPAVKPPEHEASAAEISAPKISAQAISKQNSPDQNSLARQAPDRGSTEGPQPALAQSPPTSAGAGSLSEPSAGRPSPGGQEMMAVGLSLGILAFGGILVAFQMMVMIMQKRYWDDRSLKMVGLTIIVTAGLMLVSAGYSKDQAAPMMGLLGTVAGYLLGKGESVIAAGAGAAPAGNAE